MCEPRGRYIKRHFGSDRVKMKINRRVAVVKQRVEAAIESVRMMYGRETQPVLPAGEREKHQRKMSNRASLSRLSVLMFRARACVPTVSTIRATELAPTYHDRGSFTD